MAGLRAIGMVFGILYFLFVVIVGGGLTWVSMKASDDIASMDNSSDRAEREEERQRRAYYRDRGYYGSDEWERERRRERDGITIDSDSTEPMVDLNAPR